MKKNKKIKSICWIIAIIMVSVQFFSLNTIYANTEENTENKSSVILNSIFDLKALSGEYKVSDEKSDIYLPFLRNTAEKIVIDKPIEKIGILSSGKTIEVNEQSKNLQFLFAKDTIRVNSNMEYTLIWSGNDVVINSDIARNSIIFAGGDITIGENANIGDDAIFVANSVNIKGKINGSALVTSPKINISGSIEKDLRCDTDDIDISSNDNIKGNILVNTYNKNINLKDKYSNAVINIKESNKDSNGFGKILIQILINCLMYTLLYFIIKKISKGKLYEYMLNKSKNNIIFIIISSAVCLLAFPLIFILLIILSIVGLYIVTELNPWDSFNPGRLDQHLYPYYKAETEAGTLNKDEATELLHSFWIKFNN